MELKNCETLTILNKNSKLARNDIYTLMYKADSDNDYLVQAYGAQRLALMHGRNFFTTSQKKIETITYLLAHKMDDEMWEFYSKSFDTFMKKVNNDFEQVMSFNIIFISFIGIGRKLLRISTDKYGGVGN